MQQKIRYNTCGIKLNLPSVIVAAIFLVSFILFFVYFHTSSVWIWFWICVGTFFLFWWVAFLYVPRAVSVDDNYLIVHHHLLKKKFNLKDIVSAKPIERLKASMPENPVELTFKNGSKYIIGSSDSEELSNNINNTLKNLH